ncbi:MAG: trigger factor [Methylococcales symbiont of Iophon sp. n. MRB-2018]|nr:MAG: trigger factor [Methylococcales symbiont of Iophon sp. n. MRB-2018]KAF3979822.1 MAG: trigger factor [Methylococcales symbiont of Iophon sp. n. MRB-2018]
MQVSVEKTSELSRKMRVSIPEDMIQEKMEVRFKSLTREVKIDGFRPGKVPVRIVKKLYAGRVREEITGNLIQSSYLDALKEQDLNPAGRPHIHPVEEAAGFAYTAEFEVYPKVSLDNVSSLEIKNPTATVQQADIDSMVATLRDQKKEWKIVQRVSAKGDKVTVHFLGVCEGENFTNGKVENHSVEIGSGQMIAGFEDELIGLEAGANKAFSIDFPKEHNNKKLAGKTAEFEVELVIIEEAVLPEIDAEFIKNYGVEDGTMESFNIDVKSNMERELIQGLKGNLKNAVLDALYEKIEVTVPNALIDQEIESMMKPYQENAKKQNMSLKDLDLPRNLFEKQAKRRVALGLILAEVIQKNAIKVDDAKVHTTLEYMAKNYNTPSDLLDWYYSDEKRLNEIKQIVLEEQTVEWVVSQAKMTDEAVDFETVMKKQAN